MDYIKAKHIVNKNKSNSWFGYDYTMNIYRGCNHGCIYCDSRCSCYQVKEFDKVMAKENALYIIREDLKRKIRKGVICSGAMSDPYNNFEKELRLTRNALELINAYEFGVGIITKSDLVTRDIETLSDIQTHSPVIVKLSITTADDTLSKKIEPHAPSASQRFKAIKTLIEHEIFAGVLLMPVLPFIEDNEHNILHIVDAAIESGAKFIYPRFGVTLRGNQKQYYFDALERDFPGVKEKYEQTYDGKMYCNSLYTRKLMKLLRDKCKEAGILCDMQSIIEAFRGGYQSRQVSIFDIFNK